MTASYYYVCDSCGLTHHRKQLPEGAEWLCEECGSESAWEFTDAEKAHLHAVHIRRGNESGIFRSPV